MKILQRFIVDDNIHAIFATKPQTKMHTKTKENNVNDVETLTLSKILLR